jgi:hypothetical protein
MWLNGRAPASHTQGSGFPPKHQKRKDKKLKISKNKCANICSQNHRFFLKEESANPGCPWRQKHIRPPACERTCTADVSPVSKTLRYIKMSLRLQKRILERENVAISVFHLLEMTAIRNENGLFEEVIPSLLSLHFESIKFVFKITQEITKGSMTRILNLYV